VETLLDFEFIWTVVDVVWDKVFVTGGGFGHLELMSLCHSVALMMLAAEREQIMESSA
jgi:hypothetical protein